jgi:cytoskeletal protein CcmA (bactofilin family)
MGEGALTIADQLDLRESIEASNIIAESSTFEGTLKSDKSFGIEGTVIGQISTKKAVRIANSGVVRGDVDCDNFDLAGTCDGRVRVDSVAHLQEDANLNGEISCRVLVVDSGVSIQGRLRTQKYRG